MQIKIKLHVNKIHHAFGVKVVQPLHVLHILAQLLPQVQIVHQFQALINLHSQFVSFKMEPVKLLTQEQ